MTRLRACTVAQWEQVLKRAPGEYAKSASHYLRKRNSSYIFVAREGQFRSYIYDLYSLLTTRTGEGRADTTEGQSIGGTHATE